MRIWDSLHHSIFKGEPGYRCYKMQSLHKCNKGNPEGDFCLAKYTRLI